MVDKRFKIIACVDKEGGIGLQGKLLYNIGNDKANFRNMTMNNVVVMGRATFESLPHGKPLDGRINIILTTDESYAIDECDNAYIVNSIQDAVELCNAFFEDKEWFVIGGESIYRAFLDMDLVDEMRLTIVNDVCEADRHFPSFDDEEWNVYYKSMAQTSSWKDVERSFYFEVLKKK